MVKSANMVKIDISATVMQKTIKLRCKNNIPDTLFNVFTLKKVSLILSRLSESNRSSRRPPFCSLNTLTQCFSATPCSLRQSIRQRPARQATHNHARWNEPYSQLSVGRNNYTHANQRRGCRAGSIILTSLKRVNKQTLNTGLGHMAADVQNHSWTQTSEIN